MYELAVSTVSKGLALPYDGDWKRFDITSFEVAKKFERAHSLVLRSIENLKTTGKFKRENFKKEYKFTPSLVHPGKVFRDISYTMTHEGFVALVTSWRDKKTMAWRSEYAARFAEFLRSQACPVSQVLPPMVIEQDNADGDAAPDFDEKRLSFEEHNGRMWVNSWEVAEAFGKDHRNVIRSIDQLVQQNQKTTQVTFEQTLKIRQISSKAGGQQATRAYRMTRDGFLLLAFSWRDEKSRRLLLEYMNVFNRMEETLREQAERERNTLNLENGRLRGLIVDANARNERLLDDVMPVVMKAGNDWVTEMDSAALAKMCQVFIWYWAFVEGIPYAMAEQVVNERLKVKVNELETAPHEVVVDCLRVIQRITYARWREDKAASVEQMAFIRQMLTLNGKVGRDMAEVEAELKNIYGIDRDRLNDLNAFEAKKIGGLLFSRFMQACIRLKTAADLKRGVKSRMMTVIDVDGEPQHLEQKAV